VLRWFELGGTFVFGASGGLVAVRKRFDVVAVATLALATALGGGVVRDLLIGATPPVAVTDGWLLTVALAGGAAAFVAHGVLEEHLRRPWLVFDAAGLGLFCAAGTTKALDYGVRGLGAVLCGVVSAVGGGVLRDVLARDEPILFRAETAVYAIPATAGSALVLAGSAAAAANATAVSVAAALGVFLVRIVALRYGVRAPAPRPARPAGQPPLLRLRARASRSRRSGRALGSGRSGRLGRSGRKRP
jgi:uncharacterized membrane protein YeiH